MPVHGMDAPLPPNLAQVPEAVLEDEPPPPIRGRGAGRGGRGGANAARGGRARGGYRGGGAIGPAQPNLGVELLQPANLPPNVVPRRVAPGMPLLSSPNSKLFLFV